MLQHDGNTKVAETDPWGLKKFQTRIARYTCVLAVQDRSVVCMMEEIRGHRFVNTRTTVLDQKPVIDFITPVLTDYLMTPNLDQNDR